MVDLTSNAQGWIDLCPVADVSIGDLKYVLYNKQGLAVRRVGELAVQVLDDCCPHAGGSLSAGHVDPDLTDAGCLVCPWHGWPFDLDNGRCPDNPSLAVRTYPTRITNGRIQIQINMPISEMDDPGLDPDPNI